MSSVYFDGPRHNAVGHQKPEKLSREKLWLTGKSEPTEEDGGPPAERLLSGSTLALYVTTAVVIVVTGIWVVSDINRRHRPLAFSVDSAQSAPIAAPLKSAELDGPALTPPARLGDGVVLDASPDALYATAPTVLPPPDRTVALAPAAEPAAPITEPTPTRDQAALVAPSVEAAPVVEGPATAPAPDPEPEAKTDAKPAAKTPPVGVAANCLVKVSGKVLFQRSCAVERHGARATLNVGEQKLIVSLLRGETWQAVLGTKNLGNVYQTGQCWGRRKEVYICAGGG